MPTDKIAKVGEAYHRLNEKILPILLPKKEHQKYSEKVIHDNLMESCYFKAWEVALLDTPLLQRLRHIHQLGTAFLTYPSAIHTRFSHTLGVTTLAGMLYRTLRNKSYLSQYDDETCRDEEATVRLAGLLHDIGHTFFSHCSEKVVAPFWSKVLESHDIKARPKAHEYVAYLIVTSEYFKDYWNSVVKPDVYDITINLNNVASIIIGELISQDKAYLTEIINGYYDVDKLEYLNRDAKTAGLPITYDKARYFQKIDIVENDGKASLVMGQGGIQCVEQMALGKIMLFPYVYQHHKVLTADSVIQDIVQKLLDKGNILGNLEISHPLDMLLYTDDDILAYSVTSTDADLQQLLEKIKSRSLPKRAFVFHREYLSETDDSPQKLMKFRKALRNPVELQSMRQHIADCLSTKERTVSYHEVLITQPSFFSGFSSINSAPIITKSNECVPVDKLWLLSGWSDTHDSKTDYIYFHVPSELLITGYKIIKEYLYNNYGFSFNEERVLEHCKLNLANVRSSQ